MNLPAPLSEDLNIAIEAAQHAGYVVINALQTDIIAETKGNKGLVTEFDQRAEQAIIETLQAKSTYSILGEETGRTDTASHKFWVVDPIDGTTNFSRMLPLFAISIALMQDSDILLGVIFNPYTKEYFYAEKGHGAFLNGSPIQVSTNRLPAKSIVLLDHGYAEADLERITTVYRQLGPKYSLRLLGTTALALTLVANGKADAFISVGDELWDFAAGVLLVQEAGGSFTDWRGRPWDGQTPFIFASNSRLHESLLPYIRNLQPA